MTETLLWNGDDDDDHQLPETWNEWREANLPDTTPQRLDSVFEDEASIALAIHEVKNVARAIAAEEVSIQRARQMIADSQHIHFFGRQEDVFAMLDAS